MTTAAHEQIPARLLGGPTVLLEYGGLRLLTDPTFDEPGEYPITEDFSLVKTAPALVGPADLGPVDAVLLSHDQHADNLDHSGRELLSSVPVTFTTPSGAGRLGGNARGLADWESATLHRPDGGSVTVTAVPALHGPDGLAQRVMGDVAGFVLSADDLPTVYVSGDNASLDAVQRTADRFGPVDTAVLFIGAVRSPRVGGELITINSAMAVEAARILGARRVVAAHMDSWEHFLEGRDDVVKAFETAGLSHILQA
ncbi:MBL fold metallo-hydrolase [Streptomyces sp. NPDC046862]|uniref:MBL fold metallo-hydrolase n=1 Tax=Streptomyces sp. NPDC046862 TaxID=3154603 RepID=UPI0034572C18